MSSNNNVNGQQQRAPAPQRLIFLVMEHMAGGELFDRIISKQKFTEKDAAAIMKSLAGAVHHCHTLGVAHRDLKPENILLPAKESPETDLRLADFGFARAGANLRTPLGSGFYTSPDMVKAHFAAQKGAHHGISDDYTYDKSSDCWTLGVILYILLVGRPPFRSQSKAQKPVQKDRVLQEKIVGGRYDFDGKDWSSISADAKAVVSGLMQ
eukprot:UC1_evm2s1763